MDIDELTKKVTREILKRMLDNPKAIAEMAAFTIKPEAVEYTVHCILEYLEEQKSKHGVSSSMNKSQQS